MQARWRNASSEALVFHTILSDPNIVFAGETSKQHFCNSWKLSNPVLSGGHPGDTGRPWVLWLCGMENKLEMPRQKGGTAGCGNQPILAGSEVSARLGCFVVSGEAGLGWKKCGNSLWTGVRPFPFTGTFLAFEEEDRETEEMEKRQYFRKL